MKLTQKSYWKRISAALLVCCALLLTAAPFIKNRIQFSRLTQDFWEKQLSSDTLSMHYTVSEPEKWGLKDYEALLHCYSPESHDSSLKELSNYLTQLSSINPERLSKQNRLAYHLLQNSLIQEAALQEFPYYQEPLSPGSGAGSQFPILLAEYRLDSVRDIQDYLAILAGLGPYLDGLAVYETQKADAGLFMSDSSADKLISQCSAIMNPQELAAGTHFLQATFSERLDSLLSKGILEEDQRTSYLAENDRLLSTVVQPAYDRLADTLFLLKGSGQNSGGLAHFPQGRDYYALLLRQQTGSSRSIEELKQLLLARFEDDCDMLEKLMSDSAAQSNAAETAKTTGVLAIDPLSALSADEILQHLQQSMQQDFPVFPSLTDASFQPSCTVKAVSASLEPYTAPAFYLTPPIDNVSDNVIYINRQSTPQGLSLYTTLAHEGYPGHLYQSVYYNMHRENSSILPARNLLYYGGYVEGWALYVENLSYDYAASLLPDKARQLSCSLTRLDRDMQLCLYSLLDLSIHYDGASYEKVHSLLQRFGLADPAVTRAIYEYIVEEPTNYPKYYIGYLELLELKDAAKKLWGEAYSEKRFHAFFLESGPCDFATLHALLAGNDLPAVSSGS